MDRLAYLTWTIGLVAVLSGCAGPAPDAPAATGAAALPLTRPLAGPLAPVTAAMPGELGGMTVQSLLDGTIAHIAVQPQGDRLRVDDGRGCIAMRPRDWFSPSEAYSGCGGSGDWSSATGEVRVLESLYPLTVGSTGRYWRHLVSATGQSSTRETQCRVTDLVAVALPTRPETPAYVVRCDNGRIQRTTWYAPGIGPVAYREEHKARGVREAWLRVD